ncbi:thermonuclease family protein [Sphingomonas trueperi]|jgi:endonuclease YncB( thermonuclease family)|uniref:thermonuclease family protein n=1 Tax=Sphingomonas trueperi TaxID=53317 RepID=UPI000EAF771F
MRLIATLLLFGTSSCGVLPNASAGQRDHDGFEAQARAIDGDTIAVDFRLFGADAVERKALCAKGPSCWPCGKAAQDFASKLMKREPVSIRLTGQQSYGRPIAVVDVGGQDLGETMIAAGYAVPTPNFLKTDPMRARRYEAAFAQAEAKHLGVHGGEFIEPSRWRKGARLSCERRGRFGGDER